MTDEDLLIDREEYLKRGVHIGTKSQHSDMEEFIFHVKKNQLAVIDLSKTDRQIREAADVLAEHEPEEVLLVGRKEEAREAIEKTAELGFDHVTGRFMPGTLTNPQSDSFREPEIVVAVDPETDSQVINEASDTNIPVIAVADSGNSLEGVKHAIPANNKGENSVSTVLYLLGKLYAEERGLEFDYGLEDFAPVEEEEEEQEE